MITLHVAADLTPGAPVRVTDARGVDVFPVGTVHMYEPTELELRELAARLAEAIDADIIASLVKELGGA